MIGENQVMDIGIVIPALNCAKTLSRHLGEFEDVLNSVKQVVAVGGDSNDETSELLQKISHPNVSYLHPSRGLYQAWNAGISQVNAKYVYIATAGDVITKDGLRQLYDLAESQMADVVISPPIIVDSNNQEQRSDWPIFSLTENLLENEFRQLSPVWMCLHSIQSPFSSILGSSASNLYKTSVLKENPFPCDYGAAGDAVWGDLNLPLLKVFFCKNAVATFLIHADGASQTAYNMPSSKIKKLYVSLERLVGQLSLSQCSDLEKTSSGVLEVFCRLHDVKGRLRKVRSESKVPWWVKAEGWSLHFQKAILKRTNKKYVKKIQVEMSRMIQS